MAIKTNTPKAIETYYKNTRFRSRLEAKWALFFGELGIVWDYECEGFESRGIRYLPDFFLPELDYFFEVKPYAPSKDDFRKSAICPNVSGKTLILSWGYPVIDEQCSFEMIDAAQFYMAEAKSLPVEVIKYPSISDRFGMTAICESASKTLLGDIDRIFLSQEQFRAGGLENAEISRCPSCHKFYFDTFWNRSATNYDDSWICPFECELDTAYEYLVAAATKARNHRFGRIA